MSAGFVMPASSTTSMVMPTSTVELSLKCNKLADTDVFSKSDPVCILFQQTKASQGKWVEVGRTERVKDNINPEWQTKFTLEYSFEERQPIKFEVYDQDSSSIRLDQQDFLGRCETTLGAVVAAPGNKFAAVLKDGPRSNGGRIFVAAEELKANKETVKMQLGAKNLDKKDFLGKSDPFFVISKATPSGQFVVVLKSEMVKNNLNPVWNPLAVSVRDLCNGDYARVLKVDVYDWDSDGTHDLIGSFKTDLKALSTAAIEQKKFACINDKKMSKKGYKNSGEVYLRSFDIDQDLTFLDYIQGGTAMNFSVAVDFTASNGHPLDPNSLHYMNPNYGGGDNQYTAAIKAVGNIIQDYDTDKLFPGLGFGARVPPTGQVSHEFFLNLRQDNPYCAGVDGLLQAYFTALQNVTLYGPTNFAPVINHVSRFASEASCQNGKQYFVLLIITDGIITDFEDTLSAIINASSLPMSIIILGVGNEDFSAMDALDSDRELLKHGGRTAARDMVQFVRMNKFVGGGGVWDREMLAKEVLAEVPKQMVGWMKARGLKPVMA